jgi:hypothetical protein
MIADTTLDSGYNVGLSLSSEDSANLRKAGKWGRFLGIVSMVALGLAILAFVGFGATLLATMGFSEQAGMPAGVTTFLVIFYVAVFVFSFYMVYLLYKFGTAAIAAVDRHDQAAMTKSFASLGRMLKIYGIITVIYLGFMALSLVLTLVGGGIAAFS